MTPSIDCSCVGAGPKQLHQWLRSLLAVGRESGNVFYGDYVGNIYIEPFSRLAKDKGIPKPQTLIP